MKKIIIAIKNDFIREAYSGVFQEKGFSVFETKDGRDALLLVAKEKPDIIIADVNLIGMGGLEVLKTLRQEEGQKIPVIIFTQIERKEEKTKAIDLEAKDFIVATNVTPLEVVRKVKIALGEQKSYLVSIQKNLYDAEDLIVDMGYDYNFKCPVCGSDLVFSLIRDFSRGENHFIVSVICPVCKKSPKKQ